MRRLRSFLAVLLLGGASASHAEFLFNPSNPTPNGFYTPTLNYGGSIYEYSGWDIFYSPHSLGNYPDVFAPYGGTETSPGVWAPVPRSSVPGFPGAPGIYNPGNPLAFWDTRNPTITQNATSAFIIGPDISGNIYTFQEHTSYSLANNPDYDQLGTVVFQFQTEGSLVDFSSIKLVYNNGFGLAELPALEYAEYLREYASGGGGHWSAAAGYANRVALQWDLSGLTDEFGNPITEFRIVWESKSSSMSFQKADLFTSDTYQAGIPISARWTGGDGSWSNNSNWSLHGNSGLTAPQQNGNIKFQNGVDVTVALDQNFNLGELIFESDWNVTIDPVGSKKLISNTGITTREGATGTYTVNADFQFGALNFFEINAGTVVMNGVISGAYGLVKTGSGSLVLANDNTFSGFLGIQDGALRVEGTNAYTGNTTLVNGQLIVAADAGATGALGSSNSAISVGADASLYQYAGAGEGAELLIDGDHTISRNVILASGSNSKRLGAFGTASGAVYSGTINFTGNPADPNDANSASSNVKLTARNAGDRVTFSGAMVGGGTNATVTVDGAGTVVFSGTAKTYVNATVVSNGTLLLAAGSGYTGNGNVTVLSGAVLRVDGVLGGSGSLTLNQGTLVGSGTVGRAISLANGAVISPGNSPGIMNTAAQTWGGGGAYLWEVKDGDAGAGTGWDLLNITGALTITATSGSPFEIRITSLDLSDLSGLVEDFDPMADYSWTIVTASGGIFGFAADRFDLNAADFANAPSGEFSIAQVGNSIVLSYTAIPEPTAGALCFLSILLIATRRRAFAIRR